MRSEVGAAALVAGGEDEQQIPLANEGVGQAVELVVVAEGPGIGAVDADPFAVVECHTAPAGERVPGVVEDLDAVLIVDRFDGIEGGVLVAGIEPV